MNIHQGLLLMIFSLFHKVKKTWGILLSAFVILLAADSTNAQLTSTNFALTPPLITQSSPPNIMIVMSNDHELYKKAYSDFSDIDDDQIVDGIYNDSFTYAGYFDPNFCYAYSTISTRFEPLANISGSGNHRCDTVVGDWSGNFLNWASMSRMDIVRSVLFGGTRVVDTATSGVVDGVTELERAFLPEDSHSFVKVFAGNTQWFTPWTEASISLCSTTFGSATSVPVLRAATGSWPLWSSAETVQCHYRSESGSDAGLQKPTTLDRPLAYEFDVQVQVCVAGIDNSSSRCKAY